jgi:hypothetical protein
MITLTSKILTKNISFTKCTCILGFVLVMKIYKSLYIHVHVYYILFINYINYLHGGCVPTHDQTSQELVGADRDRPAAGVHVMLQSPHQLAVLNQHRND